MCTYKKMIKINNDRILNFYISEVYSEKLGEYYKKYSIEEHFIEKDEIYKSYKLNRGDEYSFNGWINAKPQEKKKMEEVSFDFDINHPIYTPLLHMLGYNEKIIVRDGINPKRKNKFVLISKEEDKIKLSFINKYKKANIENKFDITVIEEKTILRTFFKELIEQMYQISIEEYLLKTIGPKDEKVKVYMKAMLPCNKKKVA